MRLRLRIAVCDCDCGLRFAIASVDEENRRNPKIMDPIWKVLAGDDDPSIDRLRLYCHPDPASGALAVISCNEQHLYGLTYKESFQQDSTYLCRAILPENRTLKSVEIDWAYLALLDEEQRLELLLSIGEIPSIQEVSIRGDPKSSHLSSSHFTALMWGAAKKSLRHFSAELGKLTFHDEEELEALAAALEDCQHLETIHITSIFCTRGKMKQFFLDKLLISLSKIPSLKTIHMSLGPHTNEITSPSISPAALKTLCQHVKLTSLWLIHMGLDDAHCKVIEEYQTKSNTLHSLVMLYNPKIGSKGLQSLNNLLQGNRSVFNTIFGTDAESQHRKGQLVRLHLNRCGRKSMQEDNLTLEEWVNCLIRINETVPEELELDSLYETLREHPDYLDTRKEEDCSSILPVDKRHQCGDDCSIRDDPEFRDHPDYLDTRNDEECSSTLPVDTRHQCGNESATRDDSGLFPLTLEKRERQITTREQELVERERKLDQRERMLDQRNKQIRELEHRFTTISLNVEE